MPSTINATGTDCTEWRRIRMCMCSSMGTVLSPCRSRHISYACSHESADIQIGLTCPRDVPSRDAGMDAGGFR